MTLVLFTSSLGSNPALTIWQKKLQQKASLTQTKSLDHERFKDKEKELEKANNFSSSKVLTKTGANPIKLFFFDNQELFLFSLLS